MSVNGLNTSLSGMQVNQFRMDVTANNVANVNTNNFRASTVSTADSAYINGVGTGAQVTGTSPTYAPPRPGQATMNAAAAPASNAANNTNAAANARQTDMTTGSGNAYGANNNVNMVSEMTNMRSAQNAYNSNVTMARTQNDVSRTLMDLRG